MVTHGEILRWSAESFEGFAKISENSASGVVMTPGLEAVDRVVELPTWARNVVGCSPCPPDELPEGYLSGWRYTIPLINMRVYLRYLVERLAESDVEIALTSPLTSLGSVNAGSLAVVNCTGLGSRALVADENITPVRGQLVVVENPGISEFFQDNVDGPDLTCIFPHGDHVVLGGVAAPDTGDLAVDPVLIGQILERCVKIEPRLARARIIGHRVGLRPQRPQVRVERDPGAPGRLIHNYGHGGSGVTLSWGCAREVLRLVTAGLA